MPRGEPCGGVILGQPLGPHQVEEEPEQLARRRRAEPHALDGARLLDGGDWHRLQPYRYRR
jgi:hypothetical protein